MENLNILKKYILTIVAFFSIIVEGYTQKAELLKKYSWRAIGPANMGGRVTDIDGVPGDPSTFYVSGADGGIHKTIDGGVNFKPIFETSKTKFYKHQPKKLSRFELSKKEKKEKKKKS